MEFPKNKVIAIIGPSGCGKSTFLRTLNRINDEIESFKLKGEIKLGNYDIYKLRNELTKEKMQITELRTKVGMIFQQPNPFPISIAKNVTYGPRINGEKNIGYLKELTEESLKRAAL
jgi:phosphate transport system ATP-binding protein